MAKLKNTNNFEFDVALSFAGEDRYYVDIVAKELRNNKIKVFYDDYDKINLWGKNLHDHLAEVYSKKSLYCVIFISKEYAKKVWTTHERRSAQSRAIRQKQEYILPARFDETEIVGLEDISYIDLTHYSEYQFADFLIKKLKKSNLNNLKNRLTNYIPKSKKFGYKLNYEELFILEAFTKIRFRYRAINKISQDTEMGKEVVRKKLNYLKSKGLVDLIDRPTKNKKWIITNDGKDYLDYYYFKYEESS